MGPPPVHRAPASWGIPAMTLVRTRPRLRLRPSNLSEIEAAKIGAFLRVGRHRFLCDWSIVLEGSCHVLILGDPQQDCAPAGTPSAAAILHVHEMREGQRADALVRPLQYDAFVEALSALERELMRQAARHVPAAGEIAHSPRADSAPPRRTPPIPPGASLRLRRWPPAAILDSHRYNLRLASFLSGRPLRLDELIQWSNVERAQCEQFLLALSDAGILDVKAADQQSPPSSLTTASQHSPRRAGAERGLLDRIRSHLGLGRPG